MRKLLVEAAAADTTRSYASAPHYWAGWRVAVRHRRDPALPEAAALGFVADRLMGRSAAGEHGWEVPPAVDRALMVARPQGQAGSADLPTVRHQIAAYRPFTGSN